ncbi:MAG: diguanylate cyclase, partial [Acidobacteriota bacterium]
GALIAAERLRTKIESTEVPGYGRMTASLGLASFPLHASSHDTLIAAADRALYNSKHSGRNRVSIPPEDIPQEVPAKLDSAATEEEKLVDSLQAS